MKKSEQIQALTILILGTSSVMFLTTLYTQTYILSLFGFILLIGCVVIKLIANTSIKKGEKKKGKKSSKFNSMQLWKKFIVWLNK